MPYPDPVKAWEIKKKSIKRFFLMSQNIKPG